MPRATTLDPLEYVAFETWWTDCYPAQPSALVGCAASTVAVRDDLRVTSRVAAQQRAGTAEGVTVACEAPLTEPVYRVVAAEVAAETVATRRSPVSS